MPRKKYPRNNCKVCSLPVRRVGAVYCSPKCQYGDVAGRFWTRVDKNGPIHGDIGSCWIWTGDQLHSGYGAYNNQRAHRVSYTLSQGKIPNGLMVLHKCDNPLCVNPEHLFLGTAQDNMDDMKRKGRDRKATGPGSTRIHKHGKLKPEEVVQLRKLREEGYTYAQLGDQFGINSESARLIIKGVYHRGSR